MKSFLQYRHPRRECRFLSGVAIRKQSFPVACACEVTEVAHFQQQPFPNRFVALNVRKAGNAANAALYFSLLGFAG
jgi:hypothetical protein